MNLAMYIRHGILVLLKVIELIIYMLQAIRSKVREMVTPRYKIICLIHIGQRNNQALRIGSRCLWNAQYDNYTSSIFSNTSLFAVASVYGVFFE